MKKQISILLAMAMLVGILSGCGANGETKENTKTGENVVEETENTDEKVVINIADFKQYPATSQVIIADKQGFFEKELSGDNAEANVVKFLNGPAINEAYASGDVDFSPMGGLPTLSGINNTKGQTIVATDIENYGEALIVASDSEIENLEDLKGKKVGYGVGTSDQIVLDAVLEDAGLSLDDISTVNLPDQNDGISSLLAGEVDAFWTFEPYLSNYQVENGVKVIADNSSFADLVVFTVRTEFAEKYPELVVDLLRAIQDANEWIEEHPEEAVDVVAEETGSDRAGIEATYKSLKNTIVISDEDVKILNRTADFLKEDGVADDNFNVEDYIDTSFADKVLEK